MSDQIKILREYVDHIRMVPLDAEYIPDELAEAIRLLIDAIAKRDPYVEMAESGSPFCYWCDEPERRGHAPACLWVLIRH